MSAAWLVAIDEIVDEDSGEQIGSLYTPRNIGDGETWGVEIDFSAPLDVLGMPDAGLWRQQRRDDCDLRAGCVGVYWAEYKGVYFVEGRPPGVEIIRTIDTKVDGFFTQSQLRSLDTIKDKMVMEVVDAGGNAVVDFLYGQRSSFWSSFLSLDDVRWFASGSIARITPDTLRALS